MSAAQLEAAAVALGPLLDEVVFVGGATIHLWVTDPGAPPVRATDDVDVICEVTTLAEYYRLGSRLREQGLYESIDERVICRWRSRDPELVIDVMPTDEDILGFSNPWYEQAVATAVRVELGSGAEIRAVRPTMLIATKLSAWKGRGKGDLLTSNDVHDILTLIDSRPELPGEFERASPELRSYVHAGLVELRGHSFFAYGVESALGGYGRLAYDRAGLLTERYTQLVEQLGDTP